MVGKEYTKEVGRVSVLSPGPPCCQPLSDGTLAYTAAGPWEVALRVSAKRNAICGVAILRN